MTDFHRINNADNLCNFIKSQVEPRQYQSYANQALGKNPE